MIEETPCVPTIIHTGRLPFRLLASLCSDAFPSIFAPGGGLILGRRPADGEHDGRDSR
jgi:hypothetical protein